MQIHGNPMIMYPCVGIVKQNGHTIHECPKPK